MTTMSFAIRPGAPRSTLRVVIDYELPERADKAVYSGDDGGVTRVPSND